MFVSIEEIQNTYQIIFAADNIKLYDKLILDIFNGIQIKKKDFDINIKKDNCYKKIIYSLYGLYNEFVTKNYDKMKQYYYKAIELNDECACCRLALHYELVDINIKKMIKYYNMACKFNNKIALNNMAKYYRLNKKFEKMKYCFESLARIFNDCNAIYSLALHYYYIEHDDIQTKYYLNKGVLLNDGPCLCFMGIYYINVENNIDLMKKYWLKAIKINNCESMYNMGLYYGEKENDYYNMKYYFELAILNNIGRDNKFLFDKIIFKLNKLDQYLLLIKIINNNYSYLTENIKKQILNYDIVKIYKNKCNFLLKKEKCMLCLDDDVDCIPLECCHYLCINNNNDNCFSRTIYDENKKCPLCRYEIYISDK